MNITNLYEETVKVIELPEVKKPEIVLPDTLIKIRRCESNDDYAAQNSRSTASGAFQFIDGTWNNYGGYAKAKLAPPYIQDEYALLTYQKDGTTPWNASKRCWGPKPIVARNFTVRSGTAYGGAVTVLHSGEPEYRNCVATVRMFHTYPSGGNPYATPQNINSQQPAIGAVAVQARHVMIVVSFTDTTVTIKEGNFWSGYLTQRTIPRSVIKGYWL